MPDPIGAGRVWVTGEVIVQPDQQGTVEGGRESMTVVGQEAMPDSSSTAQMAAEPAQ